MIGLIANSSMTESFRIWSLDHACQTGSRSHTSRITLASSRIIGIATNQFHVFVGRAVPLDFSRSNRPIKAIRPQHIEVLWLAQHDLAVVVHVEDQSAARLQLERVADVLGDRD